MSEVLDRIDELFERLEQVAHTPVLLVATDYDGTLAPIVSNPSEAHPQREAMVALQALARLPATHAAVISGRALSDLAELTGAPEEVHLVGSHGSEFDPGFSRNLSTETVRRRDELERSLSEIARTAPGLAVELKPASIAFHFRNAEAGAAARAVQAVLQGPARAPGVQLREGKKVLELSVVETDKGKALDALRQQVGATAAVFLGDDQTDEDAFARLGGPDLAVKVGEGESAAPFRVADPLEVARHLAFLAERRSAWLAGESAVPIERHSMLSDQRTVALVTPKARVSWFCAPRIDSPPIFAELLGGPTAGYFSVEPPDASRPLKQGYVRDSLLLETRWKSLAVTDYLDCSLGRPAQRAGRSDLVRALTGSGRALLEFAPRVDFGRVATRLARLDHGLAVEGVLDPIVLVGSAVDWEIVEEGPHQTARAEVALSERPLVLTLRYGSANLNEAITPESERRRMTLRHWRQWVDRLRIPTVAPELVRTGALILKGLCYGPTGAIAAAATTSLPEHLGGVRNWDYRYAWLRDAALSAEALVDLGSLSEAMQFLDWVLDLVDQLPGPERLRPLYTVTGQDLGPEAEIAELAGYGGSRPVRVGNAAASQVQLDVFGPVVQLAWVLCEHGAPLTSEHWRLVEAMVHAVESRWDGPDHGIWEIRGPMRHHVHSKTMCWMTIDRAIAIAERYRGPAPERWHALREEIKEDVLAKGWSEERRAFTAAYDGDDLDAAVLWIGLSGLLEPRDERFLMTVDAVERELRDGPTVYRYRGADGLPGDGLPGGEGGFHICASWLVDALVLVGRVDEARALFGEIARLAGPTGCMSEQVDPARRRALGNHPQAYSHLGVIQNALRLERCARDERRARAR